VCPVCAIKLYNNFVESSLPLVACSLRLAACSLSPEPLAIASARRKSSPLGCLDAGSLYPPVKVFTSQSDDPVNQVSVFTNWHQARQGLDCAIFPPVNPLLLCVFNFFAKHVVRVYCFFFHNFSFIILYHRSSCQSSLLLDA